MDFYLTSYGPSPQHYHVFEWMDDDETIWEMTSEGLTHLHPTDIERRPGVIEFYSIWGPIYNRHTTTGGICNTCGKSYKR